MERSVVRYLDDAAKRSESDHPGRNFVDPTPGDRYDRHSELTEGSSGRKPSFGRRSAGSRPAGSNFGGNPQTFEPFTSRSCTSALTSSPVKLTSDAYFGIDGKGTDDLGVDLGRNVDVLEKKLAQTNISGTLEDCWHSLQVFNAKQKGRLGTIEGNAEGDDPRRSSEVGPSVILDGRPNGKLNGERGNKNFDAKSATGSTARGVQADPKSVHSNKSDFIIPELPEGNFLEFNIKTTWGDKHYLGLNGIEIYNSNGEKVKVKSISADPSDINILPEYEKDPRVVENLLNGHNLTQDDMNMWLTPYTPNSNHYIRIELHEQEKLSMLRIWNYNKSRIHSYRGARDVEIRLNNQLIFVGEIERASGEIVSGINVLGDTILFTTDENILELVALNDEHYFTKIVHHEQNQDGKMEEMRPFTGRKDEGESRPFTCPRKKVTRKSKYGLHKFAAIAYRTHKLAKSRRLTEDGSRKPKLKHFKKLDITSLDNLVDNDVEGAEGGKPDEGFSLVDDGELKYGSLTHDETKSRRGEERSRERETETFKVLDSSDGNQRTKSTRELTYVPSFMLNLDSAYETISMPCGFNFTIQIHSTWGDPYYVGLNGLQIFDERGNRIKVQRSNISANPESVNILDGIKNDARTPDKLIDGVNDTLDGCHMWLAPVLPLTINRIDITFHLPVTLSAIKLWNYAKNPSRGVREFGILVDGLLVYNGELQQAILTTENGLPSIPCNTVNFSSNHQNRSHRMDVRQHERKETSSGRIFRVDQSQRPFTTMTDFN